VIRAGAFFTLKENPAGPGDGTVAAIVTTAGHFDQILKE
jgi:hypothetical protein